jgi:hypothetical protein
MVYKPTYNWGAHPVPYNGVSSHFRSLSCGERLDNSGCGQQNSKAGPISILPVRRLGRVQFLLQDILESHTFCYETILYIYILYIQYYIYIPHTNHIMCVNFRSTLELHDQLASPKKTAFRALPFKKTVINSIRKKKRIHLAQACKPQNNKVRQT